jgi:aquaporin Z
MTDLDWRRLAAELLGTFVLVFIGCTSIVAAARGDAPSLLVAAFGFGLALLAGLYAFGEVSGGHFNPAVSLAMFLDGRLELRDMASYWIAQVAGAILASLVLLMATSQAAVASTATVPASNGSAFLIELVMTAIFVAVILQASRSSVFGTSALLAIPLALVTIHLAAIPFSGSSVNPARTLGPALVGDTWTGVWIYLTAPFIGGVIAWLVHQGVVRPFTAPTEAPVAEVLDDTERAADTQSVPGP